MTYNAMYERLAEGGSNRVHGYIAYGLYKNAKREWIRQFEVDNARKPKALEVKAYVDGYTPQMLEVFHSQAASVLAEFADGAVTDARPAIVEETLKGGFWRSVGQSIAANVLYTLGLIALVVVLNWAGVDLLSIVSSGQ